MSKFKNLTGLPEVKVKTKDGYVECEQFGVTFKDDEAAIEWHSKHHAHNSVLVFDEEDGEGEKK